MLGRKLTWMAIALLLGPVASELIVAQQPAKAPKEKAVSKEEADEPVRLETSLGNVAVRVTDRQGVEVGGLSKGDSELYEDGVRQEIAFFAQQDQPTSLGLLIDKSQSIGESGKLRHVKAAGRTILEASNPQNETFYLAFDDAVKLVEDFTQDRQRILSAIDATAAEGGTSLYDAIIAALGAVQKGRYPRRALVIISDGADQNSTHTFEEALRAVQSSDTQIYFVGFFSDHDREIYKQDKRYLRLINGRFVDNPRIVLADLAQESGAEVFFPKSNDDLAKVAKRIADELHRQYLIGYYPAKLERRDAYRRISVHLPDPARHSLRVRARLGYRITAPEQPITAEQAQALATERKKHYPSLGILLPSSGLEDHSPPAPLILKDDFSDPRSGLPNDPTAFYRVGAYHLREKGRILAYGPIFTDFHAEVTVELRNGAGSRSIAGVGGMSSASSAGVGLVFRLSQDGYYEFVVATPPPPFKGHYKLIKRVNGKDVELAGWTPDSAIQLKNRIGVRCVGKTIEIYAQGRLLKRIVDSTFTSGLIGFILTEDGEGVFENLAAEAIKE